MTAVLGSVFRAVLTVSRTAFIWALDVALYYSTWGDGSLGEAWDSRSSPIQLVGFMLGLAGTLVYAQGSTRWAQGAGVESVFPLINEDPKRKAPSGGLQGFGALPLRFCLEGFRASRSCSGT